MTTNSTASTKQINFIVSLFEQAAAHPEVPGVTAAAESVHNLLVLALSDAKRIAADEYADAELTSRDARRVIDTLLPCRDMIRNHVPAADVRFRKLDDGQWGLFGSATVLVPGDEVTVVKSNGEEQTKIVGEVVSTVGPNVVVSIAKAPKSASKVPALVAEFHARFGTQRVGVALPSTGDNDLAFWYLGNKWLYLVIGGQGRTYVDQKTAVAVLAKLAVLTDDEVREAMATYGRELGHCGRCGLELTDEASRAAGIGPVCQMKFDV